MSNENDPKPAAVASSDEESQAKEVECDQITEVNKQSIEPDHATATATSALAPLNQFEASESDKSDQERGKELHREFVGMLFALATAEVAVQTATVVNSGLDFLTCLPAYSHLALGFAIVATSWVGWGWSKSSLSNIKSVFSRDFIELALDVWLVSVYFFVAKGVELPVKDAQGKLTITPSLANELLWIVVIFATYVGWDLWTKLVVGPRRDKETGLLLIMQRGWASAACAVLAYLAFYLISKKSPTDTPQVLLGDASLFSLVFLFRAMKTRNLYELRWNWLLIALLLALFLVTLAGAARTMWLGPFIHRTISNLVP